ncbi:MAG: VWA domain-containing protein [Deltaproteobacteria bacterium]|nr:VWA domain-containing protein [Deltaproteobacteria bacterium]MBW2414864.1 VWA domain-containing protein [Deltaproteobacteria bacterium]
MTRRRIDAFSLSFLDCMCCGFGAVILVFMIISNRVTTQAQLVTQIQQLEVVRLGAQVDAQHDTLADREADLDEAAAALRELQDELRGRRAQIQSASLRVRSARAWSREQTEELRKAQAERSSRPPPKTHVREVLNRGNRQYLTGLRMGGKRVLILVDASASMLDRTIVNVLIRRNMSPDAKRRAPKWKQVVATVAWLTANLDPDAEYQVYTFDTLARPLLEKTGSQWLSSSDRDQLDRVMERMAEVVPSGGTNLSAAFSVVSRMPQKPDNVYLLADGLPTVDRPDATAKTVTSKQRLRFFERAVKRLPPGVPVNVILYPFEGDPEAASAYWKLSIAKRGSFMSPSEHWP